MTDVGWVPPDRTVLHWHQAETRPVEKGDVRC